MFRVKFLRETEVSTAHPGAAQPGRCPWLGLGLSVLGLMLGLAGVTLHLLHLPVQRDHVTCKDWCLDQQMGGFDQQTRKSRV